MSGASTKALACALPLASIVGVVPDQLVLAVLGAWGHCKAARRDGACTLHTCSSVAHPSPPAVAGASGWRHPTFSRRARSWSSGTPCPRGRFPPSGGHQPPSPRNDGRAAKAERTCNSMTAVPLTGMWAVASVQCLLCSGPEVEAWRWCRRAAGRGRWQGGRSGHSAKSSARQKQCSPNQGQPGSN